MPTYLTGPCVLRRGGVSIYFESGLKRGLKSKTGDVTSDMHGMIDQFLISRMITLAGKPVDAIANLSALFGLSPSNIGESIFKGTARTITAVSLANPGVVTFSAAHNLGPAGTTIKGTTSGIAGSVAPSNVNGSVTLTIIDATTASIGINVTHAGTGGSFTPESEPCQIVSKNDNAIFTFERSGIYQPPTIHLGASKGVFSGDMQFAVLGSVSKTPTDADYWKSAVSVSFSDTTFDHTKFKRYRYLAAFGDAPYDAMRAQQGFDVTVQYDKEEIPDDNFGIGDVILKSVSAASKFIPSNLTEAQVDALVRLQDTTALRPGDSIPGDGDTDLVITGEDATTGFEVTLYGHGFKDADIEFAVGKLRTGEVAGISRRTWSAGSADPLFAFAIT